MRLGFEWFVAWRYLDERKRGKGLILFSVTALALAAGIVFNWLAQRTPPPGPAQIIAGEPDWKQIWGFVTVGCYGFAGLVGQLALFRVFLSIFTMVSAYGVYLGTSSLVIVLSVMNGFEVDLRRKILGSNAHVLVSKEDGEFTEWHDVLKKLEGTPGVVAMTPYVSSEVVIAANSNYAGVIIKGIDPATVGLVTDLEKNLDDGSELKRLYPLEPTGAEPEPEPEPEPDPDEEPIDFSGESEEEEEPIDFSGGGEPTSLPSVPPFDIEGSVLSPVDAGGQPKRRRDPRLDSLDGVLVGRELAKNLHLYIDQEVQVISPLGQDTPAGQVPRVRPFRVAGKFFSGMYEYDTKFVYVTLPALQSFLSLGDEVNGIEIKVEDMERTAPVVAAIKARLGPGYRVQDWKEINRSLFSALKLEKIAMFLVLGMIILVASFSIIANLIMVVFEKGKEIAILKSMGASNWAVMRIFMIEGLYLGAVGTICGVAHGLGACIALDTHGLPLNPEVYYIDKLPVAMDAFAIGAVALVGVLVSFVATIYPAYVAARLRPVEGLRQ